MGLIVNSTMDAILVRELGAAKIELKTGYYELFIFLVLTSCIVMNATDVIQPTLGADQVMHEMNLQLRLRCWNSQLIESFVLCF